MSAATAWRQVFPPHQHRSFFDIGGDQKKEPGAVILDNARFLSKASFVLVCPVLRCLKQITGLYMLSYSGG
jgi:hypothetical protein